MIGNITDPRTGRPVQLGAFRKRVIDETFFGSVPASLNASGTVTHSVMPSSVGYIEAATAATAGSSASITTAFAIPMGQLEVIEFTVEGLRLTKNQPNASLTFQLRTTGDYGAQLVQSKALSTAQVWHRHPTANPTKTPISYDMLAGANQSMKRRSLTWRILPQLKEAHLYEFDTLISSIQLDPSNSNNVTAGVSLTTSEAVSHAFQIETFKVYVEHN